MRNTKIILTLVSFIVIGVIFGLPTTLAEYSDQNTSNGNELDSGTLLLSLTNHPYLTSVLFPAGIKPGNNALTNHSIENAGTLDGNLNIAVLNVVNTEGTDSRFQIGGLGDLGDAVNIALWIDRDKDGTFNSGDIELEQTGNAIAYDVSTNSIVTYSPINSYNNVAWSNVLEMVPAESDNVSISWNLPSTTTNDVQGDKVSFSIQYTLNQTVVV
jgi:hypothetical protein